MIFNPREKIGELARGQREKMRLEKRNKTDLEFGFVGSTVQLHFAAAAAAVGEKLSAGHSVKKPSVTPTQSHSKQGSCT